MQWTNVLLSWSAESLKLQFKSRRWGGGGRGEVHSACQSRPWESQQPSPHRPGAQVFRAPGPPAAEPWPRPSRPGRAGPAAPVCPRGVTAGPSFRASLQAPVDARRSAPRGPRGSLSPVPQHTTAHLKTRLRAQDPRVLGGVRTGSALSAAQGQLPFRPPPSLSGRFLQTTSCPRALRGQDRVSGSSLDPWEHGGGGGGHGVGAQFAVPRHEQRTARVRARPPGGGPGPGTLLHIFALNLIKPSNKTWTKKLYSTTRNGRPASLVINK